MSAGHAVGQRRERRTAGASLQCRGASRLLPRDSRQRPRAPHCSHSAACAPASAGPKRPPPPALLPTSAQGLCSHLTPPPRSLLVAVAFNLASQPPNRWAETGRSRRVPQVGGCPCPCGSPTPTTAEVTGALCRAHGPLRLSAAAFLAAPVQEGGAAPGHRAHRLGSRARVRPRAACPTAPPPV